VKLPDILRDPVKGSSTAVDCTAFTEAFQTKLGYWDWMEEKVQLPDGTVDTRPDLETFSLGMNATGKVIGTPLYYGQYIYYG
jgi:hypothetical protein